MCLAAHTAVLLGGVIYVGAGLEYRNGAVQGIKGSYRLDVYNLTTKQWSPFSINAACSAYAMTGLDDKLLVEQGMPRPSRQFSVSAVGSGRIIVKCRLLDHVQQLLGIVLC